MIPCAEVNSTPDAIFSWAIVETEEDDSPKKLDPTDGIVVGPRGRIN